MVIWKKWISVLAFVVGVGMANQLSSQVVDDEHETLMLGSVQTGDHSVEIAIFYATDAAYLSLVMDAGNGEKKYLPLHASTYRGIPAVNLDVFADKQGKEIWVQSNWSGAEVLAFYAFGAETALTAFGNTHFLDGPYPEFMSGGAVPFPVFDPLQVKKIATFYIQGD